MFFCEKYHCMISEADCITRQENANQLWTLGKSGDPGCKACRQGFGVKKRTRKRRLTAIEKKLEILARVLNKLPDKTHQDQKRAERGRNAISGIRDDIRSMAVLPKMPSRGKKLGPKGKREKRLQADMTGLGRTGM
jgi:hypothetical protein